VAVLDRDAGGAIAACLADLERAGEGRIVNIASTEALGATAFISAYTASKHGVVGLSRVPAASFVTGAVLVVDGGLSIQNT
jgi:3-oxoacyl-[acyl-carrier protein] reductase